MAQFLSGRRTNFNVGVSSVTENTTSLQVIGNVGVGTTNAGGRSLYVIGDAEVSGIFTASRIFSSTYGEFTGGTISGTNLVGTSLSISGISTLNAISAGGTTGTSQYVLTSTGTGLIWQSAIALTGVTGINVVEDFTGGLKYLAMQTGAGTTQTNNISSNQLVYNSTTTNLGIGTTNPTSKLTVQGDARITGVVTATTFIGNLTGTATTATNLAGGAKNSIPYQTGVNTTAFIAYGNPGDILTSDGGNSAPYWAPLSVATAIGQITVRDEGNIVGTAISITQLDFRGPNIVATANVGGNIATITVADYVSISGYSTNAGIATYATNAGIATYATNAGIATYATRSGIATYATNAGIATYATNAGIATYAPNAGIATYAPNAGIATYAPNAGIATNIKGGAGGQIPYQSAADTTALLANGSVGNLLQSNGGTNAPSWASPQGLTIGYANTAGIATYATSAGIATYATSAGIATYATSAGIATYATSAGIATYAPNAGIATYATSAGIATYATSAGIATYATRSGIATYATTAGIATYATNAGISTNLKGGAGGSIPYQSAADTTALLANGSAGNLLQSNGTTLAPSWASPQGLTIGYANTAGIATNVIGGIASVTSLFVNAAGISTLGTVKISSGIITATTGVVTYYGDGSKLSGNIPNTITNIDVNATYYPLLSPTTSGSISSISVSSNSIVFNPGPNYLGIGSTTPTTNLDVLGNVKISGVSTIGNVRIGPGIITATSGIVTYYGAFVGNLTGTASTASYATTAFTLNGFDPVAPLNVRNVATNLLRYPTFVSGTASTSYVDISTSLFTFIPANGGYLGIGTTTPTTNLDVIGNGKFTGNVTATTFIGNLTGTATTASSVALDSVGLGTHTYGDYVKSITGTANQISVSVTSGEGSAPTLSIPNQFTAPQDVTVTRDLQVNRNLNVSGNVTIGGTAATIFAQELKISDPDIVLGFRSDAFGNDISNDTTSNHGGVALASTEGTPLVDLFIAGIETNPSTYKKIMWFKSGTFSGLGTDAWLINYAVGIGSTQFPNGTRLAAGNVQFTENDLAVVRNINASGIITAVSFIGTASTASFATTAFNLNGVTAGNLNVAYASTAGIATYATNAGIATSVIGGIASVTSLNVSGISTLGTVQISSGIVTATSGIVTYYGTFVGNVTGTASTASFATTAFTLNGVGASGLNVAYASTAGIATNLKGGAGGSIPYQTATDTTALLANGSAGQVLQSNGTTLAPSWVSTAPVGAITGITIRDEGTLVGTANSISTLNFVGGNIVATASGFAATITVADNLVGTALSISGISTLGTVQISSGIITASSGVVTYYGDGSKLSNIISGVSISTNTTDQSQYLTYTTGTGSTTGFGITTTGLVFNPSTNSLGIGTTNPLQKLHVLGNLLVAAGSSTGQHITQKAYELNSGTLSWEGTAGQLFSITNNLTSGSIFSVNDVSGIPSIDVDASGTVSLGAYGGNIGIGTTLPTSKLTIQGNVLVSGASTLGTVQIASGIVTATTGIVTYYGDGSKLTGVTGTQVVAQPFTSTPVYPVLASNSGVSSVGIATTGSTALVFIPSTGNLGIGSTSPTSKLTVQGDVLVSGVVTATSFSGDGSQLTGVTGTQVVSQPFTSTPVYPILASNAGVSSVGIATTGSTSLVFIPSIGNLGIGTIDPTSKLTVQGDVLVSGVVTATSFRGDGSQLSGVTGTQILTQDPISTPVFLTFANNAGVSSLGVATTGSNALTLIPSTGNLGIGTINPYFKADIVGDARITSNNKMRFGGTEGTTNFYIQYNSSTNSLDFVAG